MESSGGGGPWVDEGSQSICRDGKRFPLAPKAFVVMQLLRAAPGRLVTKRTLLDAAWPDTHVVDVVLNNAIAQLREALGDDPKHPRFIETIHRRGYRWIGPEIAIASSAEPATPSAPSEDPFVGRSELLTELRRLSAVAASGRRQLVFITGEPGIGKTALVDHFIRGLGADFTVARGRCVDYQGSSEAYRPLLEAMEELVEKGPSDIRQCFDRHAPTWLLQMPSLLSLQEREELQRRVTITARERMHREIDRALEAASRERTIVLVLEDLHWSDPPTVSLLWSLATRREPARLLIIASFRPIDAIAQQHPISQLKGDLIGKRQSVELVLHGWSGKDLQTWLDRHFTGHRFPPAFATVLETQTSGNPLFVLNAIDDFQQRGWLTHGDGSWRCAVDLDVIAAAVPDNTRDFIAVRIDRLPAASRAVLDAASAAGMTFVTQAVAAAGERSSAEVETECNALASGALFLMKGPDLEWPDGSRGCQYSFRHALYRQVLHDRLPPTQRQLFHRRIAERMQSVCTRQDEGFTKQLALHYEHAGDFDRAVELFDSLAQQAYKRCATQEVESLLGHAVMVLKRAPRSEARQRRLLELTVAHGLALISVHGSTGDEPVRETFEEARALAQTIPAPAESVTTFAFASLTHILSGRLRQACSSAEQQLAFGGRHAPPAVVFMAHAISGTARVYLGEIDAALAHFETAFAAQSHALPSDDDPAFAVYDPIAGNRMTYGLALVLSGKGDLGWSAVTDALASARLGDMAPHVGPALSRATGIAILRGDLAIARSYARELLELCERTNLPLWKESVRAQLAWLDFKATGDLALIDTLREAVVEFVSIGRLGSTRMLSMLADAYLTAGRIEQATQALDQAFDQRGEECAFDAELFRQRAAIAQAGRGADAEEVAEQLLLRAVEVANAQGARLFSLRATVDLCRQWARTGKRDQATQWLGQALESFPEDSSEIDPSVARSLRAELAASSSIKEKVKFR